MQPHLIPLPLSLNCQCRLDHATQAASCNMMYQRSKITPRHAPTEQASLQAGQGKMTPNLMKVCPISLQLGQRLLPVVLDGIDEGVLRGHRPQGIARMRADDLETIHVARIDPAKPE